MFGTAGPLPNFGIWRIYNNNRPNNNNNNKVAFSLLASTAAVRARSQNAV